MLNNHISRFKLKAETLLESNGLFVTMFAVGLATFFFYMINAGVLTHDELHSIMNVREGVYFEKGIVGYLSSPRGLFVLDVFAQFPQYCATDEVTYRLFDIAALGIAMYCAYRFMRMLFSKEIGRLFIILFFICASFSDADYNAFLAFGWTYKIHIAYLFLLLELIIWHVNTGKRSYLIASILLYVFVSGLYEAFVTSCAPIAALYVYLFKQTGKLTAQRIVRYALYYAIPELAYLAVYLFMALTAPAHYEGTKISFERSFFTVIKVTSIYLTGAMPFIRTANGMRAFASSILVISPATCFSWAKSIAFSFYAVYLLRRHDCKPGKLFGFGVVFIVSAFLLCLPYGLSVQYSDWALNYGMRGCDVSYYAFFLLIAATTCFLAGLSSILKRDSLPPAIAKIFMAIVFLAFSLIGMHSEYNNRVYAEILDWQDNKYELFDDVVHSKQFADIEDGATIYASGFIGLYHDMSYLSEYASSITGKTYTFINEKPASGTAYDYVLKYYPDSSVLALGKNVDGAMLENMTYYSEHSEIAVSEPNDHTLVIVTATQTNAADQEPDIIDGNHV